MVTWSSPDWSYLLGVVHGDGSIAPRSIEVAVGYKDADYAETLCALWRTLGYEPKTYRPRSAMKIDVHCKALRDVFAPYKRAGIWSWPEGLEPPHYLSGVFDTDGCVSIPEHKHVSIILKRSGNLRGVASMLNDLGLREVKVIESTTSFKGTPYEIESIKLSGMDRVQDFARLVHLRHPRKIERLRLMVDHITELQSHVPLWQRVAAWLEEEPRTWKEIATEFGLTKPQVDSVLGNIKANRGMEVIPPPEALSRYSVKGR